MPDAALQIDWPALPFEQWADTCATLHLWTQVIGKIRLACAPWVNHWWHVPLYVTATGLTTSVMPYGERSFEIQFDFREHHLRIAVDDRRDEDFALEPMSVAAFYREVMKRLAKLGIDVKIWTMPQEIEGAIPFEADNVHSSYDPEAVHRFWQCLLIAHHLLSEFRGRFTAKASPVHFFWGSFDLAVTRFSGRPAPPHPGAPNVALHVAREAYSHEVSSCGFWPGNGGFGKPAFYSYAYPQPDGFAQYKIAPERTFYSDALGEFIFLYDDARNSADPRAAVLDFLQSTYTAAARTANWDLAHI
jgi:hypothetical protein